MATEKIQKSSGLLITNDLIAKLWIALLFVFIPGLVFVLIDKYNKSYIVFILIVCAILAFILLLNYIINLISIWINGGKKGCEDIWMEIIPSLEYEHNLSKPSRIKRTLYMPPFEGEIKLNKAYLHWKPENKTILAWRFPTNYCFTEKDIESILSEITTSQALAGCLKPKDEFRKKELIQNRIFAYEYEDLIFELFSKGNICYRERSGWNTDFINDSIPYDVFKSALEDKYSIDSEKAAAIIEELDKKGIINHYPYKKDVVKLGDVLKKYWYIVSLEDMNFNKYCKQHGFSIPSRTKKS